jgi:HEAT repeat protein
MAKSSSIETVLAKLASLKLAPRAPETAKELRSALTSKTDYVVQKAAEFIREFNLPDFEKDLAAAFMRVASQGDKSFGARTALASALHDMRAYEPDVYLAGLRTHGSAPPQGIDPASPLRGICVMAMVLTRCPGAMLHATDLLIDKHVPARAGAVRALASSGEEAAALVLRLKLHLGDRDAEVVGEVLAGLIQLDPANSLPLVAGYLDHPDEAIADAAALALGESRRPEAVDILRKRLAKALDPGARRPLLLAIAITRRPEAATILVEHLASADPETSRHVLEALRIYRADSALCEKVRKIVEQRGDEKLRGQFEKLFH